MFLVSVVQQKIGTRPESQLHSKRNTGDELLCFVLTSLLFSGFNAYFLPWISLFWPSVGGVAMILEEDPRTVGYISVISLFQLATRWVLEWDSKTVAEFKLHRKRKP